MKKRYWIPLLVLLLSLLLPAGVGAADGADSSASDARIVRVSTVDELVAAIAPDTAITLAAGTYDFSTASSYGRDTGSPYTAWEPVYDDDRNESFELVITGVDRLTLRGAGMDRVNIHAVPRYANVLHFSGCSGLTLSRLTAGHTQAPGYCAGGVFLFEDCSDVDISFCGMFGCGTVGVEADRCADLSVRSSRIYDCRNYAVYASGSRNIRVTGCEICNNGGMESPAFAVLEAYSSDGFLVSDCRIHDNECETLLNLEYSKNVLFLSNRVEANQLFSQVFALRQYDAVVDGCSFELNSFAGSLPFTWYLESGLFARDLEGNTLTPYLLKTMTWSDIDPDDALSVVSAAPVTEVPAGSEIHVGSVDEFLAALGPDRTVVLDAEVYDLSTASDYGRVGGAYYFWRDCYDGPELVIHGADHLSIRSAAGDPLSCSIGAVPRYANVLCFSDCSNLTLTGFTAGHFGEQGSCSGGVLYLDNCSDCTVESCRLYGCGILGIQSLNCADLYVRECEIYDCSQGGIYLWKTDVAEFESCDIHDVAGPAISLNSCRGFLWNGSALQNGLYDLNHGVPIFSSYGW